MASQFLGKDPAADRNTEQMQAGYKKAWLHCVVFASQLTRLQDCGLSHEGCTTILWLGREVGKASANVTVDNTRSDLFLKGVPKHLLKPASDWSSAQKCCPSVHSKLLPNFSSASVRGKGHLLLFGTAA